MTLDEKTIETVAIAISIAAGCEPCTKFHAKAARKLGATDLEMMHIVALAGSNWSESNAFTAAINEIVTMPSRGDDAYSLTHNAVLARVGVSVCRNCVRLLQVSMEVAQEQGVADEELMTVIALAARIKQKAAAHLDRVIDRLDVDDSIGYEAASLCV